LVLAALLLTGCKNKEAQAPAIGGRAAPSFVVLTTSLGVIKVRLFTDKAPRTCAHFIGLATGAKSWRDPRSGQMMRTPLYDGVVFHRVIPGFMIQTGDPLGDGRGEIGLTVADEFHPELRYDRPGLLGMANAGPDTAGSQFFITLAAAPVLDGRHSLFGEVVEGLGVAKAIADVPREEAGGADRPLTPVLIETLRIVDRLK
jgi:peptidyl-prolyl cis-trans isomerase A (cyclophilin A)